MKQYDFKYLLFSNISIGIFLLGLFAVLLQQCNSLTKVKTEKSFKNLLEKANDSTRYYKDRYGKKVAENSLIEAENAEMFLLLESKNETLGKLQKLVEQYKKELKRSKLPATVIETEYVRDTVVTTVKNKNIYSFSQKNKWEDILFSFNSDTEQFHYTIKMWDSYEILHTVKRNWFKPNAINVMIRNNNPFIKVRDVKSFRIKEKRKPFGLGLSAGYGVGGQGLSPFIGIGINYNLINF